ncbi:MAG: sigma-54 dependent transcriptional regulator [Thermoanaerobaculia bacterium]|nr:sigma-54 dependent transcriptional regulator [Thermoanaerobaculia bacterium]
MPLRILVVEDRESLRQLLARALAKEGYEVALAAGRVEAETALAAPGAIDLVLTDLKLPDGNGLEVLRAARGRRPEAPVVVMTAYGSVAAAVEAMKLGAADFLEKPVGLGQLRERLSALLAGAEPPEAFLPPGGAPPIVGRHPRLRAALRLLERVAPTDSTVLLTGASGTGKELFARALHALSPRASGPFVTVNCAAIPETLLENELFGHERGAFTGAVRAQKGRFELAEGGTLLLDEIGELPLGVQGKVLRALEERTVERVGGGAPRRVDVRLVAATNRRLGEMVARGEFRGDLFYRLDVFPIPLPALAERAGDVPLLARHLLRLTAERHRLPPPELDPGAFAWLSGRPWPGNVRELANLLERAAILHPGEPLGEREVAALATPPEGQGDPEDDDAARIRAALVEAGGDLPSAAASLGISLRTMQRKVKEHDLGGVGRYRP